MASTLPLNPPWNQTQDYSHLLPHIQNDPCRQSLAMKSYLESLGKTARFNGDVSILELEGSAGPLKAAFKAYSQDLECAHAEAFASNLSQFFYKRIGRNYIPQTAVRTFEFDGKSKTGACSYFVETDLDLWKERDFNNAMNHLDPIDRANASGLIFLMSQWDNHPGNWLAPLDLDPSQKKGMRKVVLIDNEGIINYTKGPYGERPWVSVAFSEQAPSGLISDYLLEDGTSQDQFASQIQGYGFFLPEQRIRTVFNNLVHRGEQSRKIHISHQRLFIQYHHNNPRSFPNCTPDLPQNTMDAMRSLDISALQDMGKTLIEVDPLRFDPGKSDFFSRMLRRRDEILAHVRPMEMTIEN